MVKLVPQWLRQSDPAPHSVLRESVLFLADRTQCAYATVLRLSSSVWLNGAS